MIKQSFLQEGFNPTDIPGFTFNSISKKVYIIIRLVVFQPVIPAKAGIQNPE
ncbi:hypothetical protein Cpar_0997 [Chlorobaculum parvum NCIB 8327]|uniref:Uncharacterized protein n=1 Tax=Chlorobaculum parvum (strain DSM 263 / NCIMB 8327) TaxID=517417 RepID=B3QNA2_CHLP8|nr:hypothetical protein Cpar_0997 [Chlorobaculum parvum NCIB 8327]